MSIIQQLTDAAKSFNQQGNYEGFAALFILPAEQAFGQLAQELQGVSDGALEKQLSRLDVHGPEFAEILRKYLRFVRLYPSQDWGAMAKVMVEVFNIWKDRSCAAIVKPKQIENKQIESIAWFMPSFRKLCRTTFEICTAADRINPRALTRGNAYAELRTLLGIANLRQDKDRVTVVLFLGGQIVRLSLLLDVQGALAHTQRQISGAVANMQEAPQADRLRYCYWAGRWHLLEHRVGVAYPLLKTAFAICPNRMMKHKRSIFRQLLGAAIPLGIFPHPVLLRAFGFHTYFLPVIKAMKAADAIALAQAIDSPEPREWFRRCGLHTVFKEKCWVALWRNLVYKTYKFLEQTTPGGRVESMSLSLIGHAFRCSYDVDDGWDPQRIQSIVMSLVAQGYIIGRVEGISSLSLKPNGNRRERFPVFGSVRQTYQVQTVWGVNLK